MSCSGMFSTGWRWWARAPRVSPAPSSRASPPRQASHSATPTAASRLVVERWAECEVRLQVSQHWFPDSQRTMATSLLGMSYPLGIVVGQGLTPIMVQQPHHIPYMNIAFFIPAFVGTLFGIFLVKEALPPSPPSASEEMRHMEQTQTKK